MSLKQKRILLCANSFWPSIGGYETFALFLAEGLARNNNVTVVSDTPEMVAGGPSLAAAFDISRRPHPTRLRELAAAADLLVLNSVSLKYMRHLAAHLRRTAVVHHTTYESRDSAATVVTEAIKRRLTAFIPLNICVSERVAARINGTKTVIHNPYDSELFRDDGAPRAKAILFVGRLVTEKRVDLLFTAFQRCRAHLPEWRLTIIGSGPDVGRLESLAAELGIAGSVTFAGAMPAAEVAEQMRRHAILAVPSRHETFGIVALEGLASGCRVVYSDIPGLNEACAGFGYPFGPGDIASLADALVAAASQDRPGATRPGAPDAHALHAHLAAHTREAILKSYVDTLGAFVATRR